MWKMTLRFIVIFALLGPGCFALAGNQNPPRTRYDNHYVIQVNPQSQHEINYLNDLGAILLSCHEGCGPTDYVVHRDLLADITAAGINFLIHNVDLQAEIDAEQARLSARGSTDPRDEQWFEDFKTFDEIVDRLNAWVIDYPQLVSLIDIGDSIEGRDIWALRISGSPDPKPGVLYNGTQHAREWISPMMNMFLAEHLIERYETDPQIRHLVDHLEIYIVPVVNPDGYVYSWTHNRLWRKNRRDNPGTSCDGVDPNRNWGVAWGEIGSSGSPCSQVYHGTAPFSEPETQAMRDFYFAHPLIISNIDFHSYSQLILWPYGHTTDLAPDHPLFNLLGVQMHEAIELVHGEAYDYGPAYTTIYPVGGASIDWCYDDQGIISYTFELRPESSSGGGFILPPEEIIPACEEVLPAALILAEWSTTPVKFNFHNGPPQILPAGLATPIEFRIESYLGVELDPVSVKLYSRLNAQVPFTETLISDLGNQQFEVTMPAVPLGGSLEYYFVAESLQGLQYTSPLSAPDEFHLAHATQAHHRFNLNTDPGWESEGQWEFGIPLGQGGQYGWEDPTSGYTGVNVYGYNLAGDYPSALSETHLTTTALDCTDLTRVTLRFQRWLGVESSLGVSGDHAYIRVSTDGQNWITIWENGQVIMDGEWSLWEFDISDIADFQSEVYLRWTMGRTNTWKWFCGWNIDDIELWAISTSSCPHDLNRDGIVNINDVFYLLGQWDQLAVPADVTGDGYVDLDDIMALLDAWGECDE